MAVIDFKTKLYKIGTWTILKLPENVSAKLPSRGIVMVEGNVNGYPFRTVLEPDGRGKSHWFRVDKLFKTAKVKPGSLASVEIEPTDDWILPVLPADFKKALIKTPKAKSLWPKITPMAQWEWIRWIRSTKQAETRQRRIEVACSKLNSGMRRPCCFNRNACTESYVSENWVLIEPTI